jgi:hypothetical protein
VNSAWKVIRQRFICHRTRAPFFEAHCNEPNIVSERRAASRSDRELRTSAWAVIMMSSPYLCYGCKTFFSCYCPRNVSARIEQFIVRKADFFACGSDNYAISCSLLWRRHFHLYKYYNGIQKQSDRQALNVKRHFLIPPPPPPPVNLFLSQSYK